jgi:membrane-bound metal-dependent hydrolase YbcI (DUF457 family)
LPSLRAEPALLAVGLVGVVCGLDLLWALTGFSTGSLAYGLIDEPAHLATCVLALLALRAGGVRLSPAFCAAALVASVAIDVDHLPGYLGWDGLIGAAPRPYSHGLLTVAAFLLFGFLASGRYRLVMFVMFGIAYGIGCHLLRDVATGPGAAIVLPVADDAVRIPYPLYLGAVAMLAAFTALGRPLPAARAMRTAAVPARAACLAVLAVAALTAAGLAASDSATAGVGHAGKQSKPSGAPHSSPKKEKHAKGERHSTSSQVAVGIYMSDSEEHPELLDTYTNAVGKRPAIIHLYRKWFSPPFDTGSLSAIWERGAVPLITWEPWSDWDGTGIALSDIGSGMQDAYIAAAAREAAAWGGPIFVRFAHEMNGNWYPWGQSPPAAFKSAWRRIVSIFRSEGATNVRWVWTPYVDQNRLPFKRYYPGDAWVDWAGLDGFNWGNPFQSFREVFEASYRSMVRLTSKPLMIAETGSVEGAGEAKSIWIRTAVRRILPRLKHVRALVWWSAVHPNGTDWRIDTSPAALAALGGALQPARFSPARRFLFSTPGWLRKK